MMVALCQEVGGAFSGLFGVFVGLRLCEYAIMPSLKAQAPNTSLVH